MSEELATPDESLLALRRDLHTFPELRFNEIRTAQRIAAEIETEVDELVTGIGGTGVLARVDGLEPGPLVMVRVDIDAYPVSDLKTVSYRSRHSGVAHACGHDVHTTVGVGVLRYLARNRPRSGSVVVLFQPAEEIPFGAVSGAATVLGHEALAGLNPVAVLGIHCWPQLEAGVVGIDQRFAMGAKDAFEVTVSGRSAHAATPADGRDAILAAAAFVMTLHGGVARRRDPNELFALNVGTIAGGTSQSSLATEVNLTGTLRTHDQAVRERLRSAIAAFADGTGVQFDSTVKLRWANEMPAVINDGDLVAVAHETLQGVANVVSLDAGPLTSDDFALYATLAPTLYLKLGIAPPGLGPAAPLHSGNFDVDERSIRVGVNSLVALCLDLLARPTGGS